MVEFSEVFNRRWVKAYLFVAFPQRCGPQAGVVRFSPTAGKADLTPVAAQVLSPAGQHHRGATCFVAVKSCKYSRRPGPGGLKRR